MGEWIFEKYAPPSLREPKSLIPSWSKYQTLNLNFDLTVWWTSVCFDTFDSRLINRFSFPHYSNSHSYHKVLSGHRGLLSYQVTHY